MDSLSPEKRSWNMSRIRSKDTTPEMCVRSTLHRAGYRFRLHVKDLPGRPDIVLPKYKTVIFVHGCFWHRHPNCQDAKLPKTNTQFWERKLQGNVERDRKVETELKQLGWNVIIVWECEIHTLRNDELLSKVFLNEEIQVCPRLKNSCQTTIMNLKDVFICKHSIFTVGKALFHKKDSDV